MKSQFSLIAALIALPLLAQAEGVGALQIGTVQLVLPEGQEGGDRLVLFAAEAGGQVGGGVVSDDGSLICPDAWQARAVSDAAALHFTDITLTQAPCGDDAALRDFADLLGRVSAEQVTDEGILLLDASATPLLRLVVGG